MPESISLHCNSFVSLLPGQLLKKQVPLGNQDVGATELTFICTVKNFFFPSFVGVDSFVRSGCSYSLLQSVMCFILTQTEYLCNKHGVGLLPHDACSLLLAPAGCI